MLNVTIKTTKVKSDIITTKLKQSISTYMFECICSIYVCEVEVLLTHSKLPKQKPSNATKATQHFLFRFYTRSGDIPKNNTTSTKTSPYSTPHNQRQSMYDEATPTQHIHAHDNKSIATRHIHTPSHTRESITHISTIYTRTHIQPT